MATLAQWEHTFEAVWNATSYSNIGYIAESILFSRDYTPTTSPVNDCSAFAVRVVHERNQPGQFLTTTQHGAFRAPINSVMIDSASRNAFIVGPERWPPGPPTPGKWQWWIDAGTIFQQHGTKPAVPFAPCTDTEVVNYSRAHWAGIKGDPVFLFRIWRNGGAFHGMIKYEIKKNTLSTLAMVLDGSGSKPDPQKIVVTESNVTATFEWLNLWVQEAMSGVDWQWEQTSEDWGGNSAADVFERIVLYWLFNN